MLATKENTVFPMRLFNLPIPLRILLVAFFAVVLVVLLMQFFPLTNFLNQFFNETQDIAQGNTFYVDKDSLGGASSDSNPGTISRPWSTIGKANSAARAGDTIYIRKGNYSQTIRPARSGTQGEPITFVNYNSENVVINKGGSERAVDLDNRHYIRILGLVLTNAAVGVNAENASHITIQDCVISHMKGSYPGAVYAWNCNNITIRDNIMYDIGIPQYFASGEVRGDAGDLINMRYFHHCLIEGNTCWLSGHRIIHFLNDVHYNVIRNNRFYNPWEGGGVLGKGEAATHNLIEGNEFFGAAGWNDQYTRINENMDIRSSKNIVRYNKFFWSYGMGLRIGAADYGAYGNKVYHNVFFANGLFGEPMKWMCHLLLENTWGGPSDIGNIFKNNIFWGNTNEVACTIVNAYDSGCGPCGSTWQNNDIIYQSPGAQVFWTHNSARSLSSMQSSYSAQVKDNLEVDPSFVQGSSTELVMNGGLESWNSPNNLAQWTENASGGSSIARNAQEAYKGNACAKLTVDAGNSRVVLSQSGIQVEPDTEYYFCFKYKNTEVDLYGTDYEFRIVNETDGSYLNERGSWSSSDRSIKIRNCIGRSGGYMTGNGILFRTPANASTLKIQFQNGNAPSSALYIDEVSLRRLPDFQIQPDSGMIEAGTFLTYTTSAGSGSTITVQDASYFTDGYGIIEGDTIMLEGSRQEVTVLHADYDNNVLTIDTNLDWESGKGISLLRYGSFPEIGLYEVESEVKKGKIRR
jgi:hypothetical protein